MATYKQIGDGLITKLVAVSGFNTRTALPFTGSVVDFYNNHTCNTPFALVAFDGAEYDGFVNDNTIANERARFKITVVAQDLRGQGYSMDDNSTLLDLIRDAIQGVSLTYLVGAVVTVLPGLEPVKLELIEPDADLSELGLTAYVFRVSTAQVRQ